MDECTRKSLLEIRAEFELLEEKCQILNHENEYIRSMLEDIVDIHLEKIKLPHRCPICNGATLDEENSLCIPCDGRGIVWG
ncbi:hypothetical protein UFOVP100_42 [uncultured Caudovirales phage]|uniref:Uncharacterized protein n=1 Tax=uncultured Caudovirales phage TaxID=2100421 RepID=A0A6J5L420_9CAUD|nr:hypothetical protein UFOVP100_42 [uncultured Caudovirales phage]